MVLGVEVRLPQEPSREAVRLDRPRVEHRVVRDIAVRVLGVADVVDGSIPDDAGRDPPEDQKLDPAIGRADGGEDESVDGKLEDGPELHIPEDCSVYVLGQRAFHAPSKPRIVRWDAERGANEAAHAMLKVARYVEECLEVARSGRGCRFEL